MASNRQLDTDIPCFELQQMTKMVSAATAVLRKVGKATKNNSCSCLELADARMDKDCTYVIFD